jgi:tripartite-type tricarboxylate transporter receptor subunit TctC
MRIKKALLTTLIAAVPMLSTAHAAYPDRPITLIVPFAPGGGTDIVGRLIAERLGRELNQSVIVANKPGAGAALGAGYVANAQPDGYTLLLGTSAEMTIGPNLREVKYDPVKSFEPIGRLGVSPNVILASKMANIDAIPQLISEGKKKGSKFSYGSGGVGTGPHLAGELLSSMGDFPFLHVPYRGSGPAMVGVIGGDTPFMVSTLAPALPAVKEGNVIPVAVTSLQRSDALPDVPTVAEQGLPGYESVTWYALMAPANVPGDVRKKLGDALGKVLAQNEVVDRFASLGISPIATVESPDDIRAKISSELTQWGDLIKERKIKVD